MSWSYRKLVAAFGEDAALELLQTMKGFGEFDAKTSHWEDRRDTPCVDVHDELPIKYPAESLAELRLEVGVDVTLWREINKKPPSQQPQALLESESILSILKRT